MTYLCMSWDHRALDGALAAQFLSGLRKKLEALADQLRQASDGPRPGSSETNVSGPGGQPLRRLRHRHHVERAATPARPPHAAAAAAPAPRPRRSGQVQLARAAGPAGRASAIGPPARRAPEAPGSMSSPAIRTEALALPLSPQALLGAARSEPPASSPSGSSQQA